MANDSGRLRSVSSHCYRASDWSSPQLLALVVAIEEYGDTLPQGSAERDCIREVVRQIGLADKRAKTVASAAPLSLPTAETLGDGIISDANDLQNRDSEVRNKQHSSDMAEMVARALARHDNPKHENWWPGYERRARAALEASHHDELVKALGLASNEIEEQLTIGFNRRSLEILGEEIDALLAKIGGGA